MSHTDEEKRVAEAKAAQENGAPLTKEYKITCIRQAQQLAAACDFAKAEDLFCQVGEIDNAIMMYKKCRDYNAVIRLVSKHRPQWLLKMHLSLGQQLESEGDYARAETHYVEAKEWMKAVTMYRERKLEVEANRVAETHCADRWKSLRVAKDKEAQPLGGTAAAQESAPTSACSPERATYANIKAPSPERARQYALQNEETYVKRHDDRNAFVDNDHQLIGEADVWLQSLGNMIEHDATAAILAPTGQSIGQLSVEVNPLDKNNEEGPWEDDREDLDPFVEDPQQLLNQKINCIVKVKKATFDVDLKAALGQCKYCDTFVRYKFDSSDDSEEFTETPKFPACAVEVEYKSSQKHSINVTPPVLKLLVKGRIVFQVYGKIATQFAGRGVADRLPAGWKRVTAYEDPEGKLHHTLPPR